MAQANSLCLGCKNKTDNIFRIAKAQNKLEWFNTIRSNDVQLQQVLTEYMRRKNVSGPTRRKITMQYLETVVMTSRRLAPSFLGLPFWALVFCTPLFLGLPELGPFRFHKNPDLGLFRFAIWARP